MKRYDSYKDSGVEWIGEIPMNWKSRRFSYSINIQKGKIPKDLTDEQLVDSLPYLSMGVLRGDEPLEFSNESGVVQVSKGDIGLLWDGSNSGEVIRINREGILSSTVSLLSLKDDTLDKEFSFYLLKFYEKDFRENTIGMGIPHVSGDHVRESKLIIPPLSEQQQIVSFLDTKTSLIDSLIEKTQRKIELLKEKRTSLINEIVTKGLNPNVDMKDSGVEWIGEIPSHWEFVRVGHLNRVVRGGSPRPSGDPRFFNGDFIHWITVRDITSKTGKYVTTTDTKLTEEGMKQSRVLEPETLVLTNSGVTLGIPGILKIRGCINDGSVSFLDMSPKIERDYLYYFWTTQTELLLEQQSGYGQPNLNIEIVSNVRFPLPPLSEQQQIVEYLDEQTQLIDNTISVEQRRIDTLKEYRQSLISEVVTGKLKVTTDE
jgi:type I restriction enzyme, S subunit